MKRRPRLARRSLFPLAIALLSGLVIGVGVAGLPDPETLNPVAGRPPLTVKPGVLVDPSEFTVPPLLLSPSSLPSVPTTSTTSTTTTVPGDGLRIRNAFLITVANGNRTAGAAAQWADRLVSLGYGAPALANAGQTMEWTIYFAEGFEGEAQRLAADLAANFLPVVLPTVPLSRAPQTDPPFQGQILLVLGMRDIGGASSPSTNAPPTTTATTTTTAL